MQRGGILVAVMLALACQGPFAFALTVDMPVEGSLGEGAVPSLSSTTNLSFGNVYVSSATNELGLYTNGVCDIVENSVCLPDTTPPAVRAAGMVEIANNDIAPIVLEELYADADFWTLGTGTLSMGAGNSSSSYESPLENTSHLSFSNGIGTCSGILNPSESCQFYISGHLNSVTTTPGAYQVAGPITLTVSYDGSNTATTQIQPTININAAPQVAVQVVTFPYFGNVVLNAPPADITLGTNDSCTANLPNTCSGSASGIIAITANSSVNLDTISANANEWSAGGVNNLILNIGTATAPQYPLTTVTASFASGIGTCTSSLTAGNTCYIYIGGNVAGLTATGSYETSPITLTLGFT